MVYTASDWLPVDNVQALVQIGGRVWLGYIAIKSHKIFCVLNVVFFALVRLLDMLPTKVRQGASTCSP
jgi:hypothetical protein